MPHRNRFLVNTYIPVIYGMLRSFINPGSKAKNTSKTQTDIAWTYCKFIGLLAVAYPLRVLFSILSNACKTFLPHRMWAMGK